MHFSPNFDTNFFFTFWVVIVVCENSHVIHEKSSLEGNYKAHLTILKQLTYSWESNVNRKESFMFLRPQGLFVPLMIEGTVMCVLQNRTIYHCVIPAPVTYLVKYTMFWPWVALRASLTVGLLFCFYINLVPLHVLMDWVLWPWFPRILLGKTRTTLMWRLT